MQPLLQALQRNKFHKGQEDESFLRLFIAKRLIQGAAIALLGIFMPIFLYEVSGQQFVVVGSYYASISLLYVLLLAPGMKVVNRIGFSHALAVGALFCVLMNGFLFFVNNDNLPVLLPFVMISMIGYWIFHWVPFQVDFVLFSRKENRSRQVSLSLATQAFLGVIGPLLAGFIVANAGYKALFGTAVVLMLAAAVSYLIVPETNTKFTWTVKHTWRKFFDTDNRKVLTAEFAFGAETIVNLVVWPVFLFEILQGNLLEVGAVSTIVVAATIIIQLSLGGYLDKHVGSLAKTLHYGSILNAIGWVIKIFVLSAVQVFFVGIYHNIVRMFARTPYFSIVYDASAEQGRYVDEFTVLREMAQHLGRAASLILVAFLSIFVPIGWTFLIAATASIAFNLVQYTKKQGA